METKVTYSIYKFSFEGTSNVYIGITKQTPSKRKAQHLRSLKNNIHPSTHFQNAFLKYGTPSFEVLEARICSIDEARDFENQYLNRHKNNLLNCEKSSNYGAGRANRSNSVNSPKKVAVISDTGVINVFTSMHEAARAISGCYSAISRVIKGEREQHKGYKFELI